MTTGKDLPPDRLVYDDGSYSNITYDAIGNPIYIEDSDDPDVYKQLVWKGRQLASITSYTADAGRSVRFTYNADGIRTSKTVGGVKHRYYLEGSRILAETWTKNNIEYFLYFIYDENGAPAGIEYRTSVYDEGDFDYYFFDKNVFGDIVGIYNENGRKICTYTYDAWGVCETTLSSGISSIERAVADQYNPFRYRGYYYDVETGYYYLQTRYYNPEWGRFLNADGYLNANGDILGYNMFAYCSNNPVMCVDPTGRFWLSVVAIVAITVGIFCLSSCSISSDATNSNTASVTQPVPSVASSKCTDFISEYEQFSPVPYDDGYGNLTIGYGHLISSGETYSYLSKADALKLLKQDMADAERLVTMHAIQNNYSLTQNQYDAFVSLTFNSGSWGLEVMDDIFKRGIDPTDAFSAVCKSGGKFSVGLWRRRMDEVDIYLHGEYQREERIYGVG